MSRFLSMKRLGILFISLFAISLAGMVTYQHFYVAPQEKCVAEGRWWYEAESRCVTPLYLPDITEIGAMNEVWDAWVAPGNAPPRATVQAALANPAWKIEVVVTAAQR